MNLKLLALPFKENEIEWRIGSCGKKGNGQIWATCLAYIQARAIMDRLDEVCGPENWRVSYEFVSASQGTAPGVIARLSIFVGDKWITKEDGAEQTDIEQFKGGLSSALKRAGSVWGIGRYLYGLESGFAHVDDKGRNYGKTKDGAEFHWNPPNLPQWALPQGEKAQPNGAKPEQPPQGDGHTPDQYVIPFGKWRMKSLEQIMRDEGPDAISGYIQYLEDSAIKQNKPIQGQVQDFITRAAEFLGSWENQK